MKWGVGAVLLALITAGCGGKPDGCTPVSDDVASAVLAEASSDLRVRPATGQAIKADTGVYFVAYRINAAGSDEVGVWAITSIDPPGAVRAVDGYAQQFTRWPVLENGNGSQPADDAIACLD